MKHLYTFLVTAIALGLFFPESSIAQQNVLDPDDPIINYDPNDPPQRPANGVVGKWVRTRRVNWNTDNWKAYYYNGIAFRVLFPKSYKSNPNKKYPMLLFFHGAGEKGTIYDNELQLANCGRKIQDSVLNGTFDGFVLFPQSQSTGWYASQFSSIVGFINYMINNSRLDRFRITVSGLSGGGDATWNFMSAYPKLVSAATPISATTAAQAQTSFINTIKDIPIWLSQGGKDVNPNPSISNYVIEQYVNAGMDIRTVAPGEEGLGPQSEGFYIIYPTLGHNTWDAHYAEPKAFEYMLRTYKSNPHVYFGRREFCPGDNFSVKLEVTSGFDGYEWSKNGILIQGANTNQITISDTGIYAARIKDGSVWSDWSHWPAHITFKGVTTTPPIQVSGLMSRVIPAPDGNTSVNLELPAGYASYEWRNAANEIVGTQRFFTAAHSGNYVARVMELYGCSATPSDPFYIADADGPNPPDPVTNLQAVALSQTSIRVSWNDNSHPVNNELAFEIYRSDKAGGPYQLVGIRPSDSLNYIDSDLNANAVYYYVVRAVDSTAASSVSSEINAKTLVDTQAPTPPGALTVVSTTENSVGLRWNSATDDAMVNKYFIYVNGQKSYVTQDTSFIVYNLVHGQSYVFTVKASDPTGNVSVSSNQVIASATFRGLRYNYYTYTGSWSGLPNLDAIIPKSTGTISNVSLDPATQTTNYAFSYQGYINIRKPGNYTFYTSSDDGSKLYINNSIVVNNDGSHGTVEKSGTYNFNQVGIYPFRVDYYQGTGGASLSVSWRATSIGIAKSTIPDSAFVETIDGGGGQPSAPTNIVATAQSYNRIKVTWDDNSNNESGFEVYRRTESQPLWYIINTVPANVESIIDTLVEPATTYFYKVQAINKYGSSGFDLASAGGLNYNYYELESISTMPNFDGLNVVESGSVSNVTIDIKKRASNYAIKFFGSIYIPSSGQYTFYTKSDDGSNLYIDGFDEAHRVVNNNYLQSPTERSGNITLTSGVHLIYVTFFQSGGGDYLDISYKGPGVAKQHIPDAAFANGQNKATTMALPSTPSAPSNLQTFSISPNSIKLTWSDQSNNEANFRIYRSIGDSSNYLFLAEVDSDLVSYSDTGLYSNTDYYYKVRAVNIGGESAFSNESHSATMNNAPRITSPSGNFSIRYGVTDTVEIIVHDSDNEPIDINAFNLPTFGSFVDKGDGLGVLTFLASLDQQGVYPNILIVANDQHGGVDSLVFTLTVNSEYTDPIIHAPSTITLTAGVPDQEKITADYEDTVDSLIWTASNTPSFVTLLPSENGRSLVMNFMPTDSNVGHFSFSIKASNSDGTHSNQQNISLDVRRPQYIYVNFNDGTNSENGFWNNTNKKVPALGDVFPNLLDSGRNVTSVGLKILSNWEKMVIGSNNSGAVTGNNSGIFPDNVLRSAYWTDHTASQSIQVFGLDTSYYYSFTFLGSRSGAGDRTSNYSIGSHLVSLNASGNTASTVSIDSVKPDSNGSVSIVLSNGGASNYAYLNAMVIKGGVMPDNSAPFSPSGLTATNDQSKFIRLSWNDRSDNETGFQIYRKIVGEVNYSLIATLNANVTDYKDSSVIGMTQYSYLIRAYNLFGNSDFDGPVQITTPNTPPVIDPISDLNINQGESKEIAIKASTADGNILSLSVMDLPAFAEFVDSSNGRGLLILHPDNNVQGNFSVTIKAADNMGSFSLEQFTIHVLNPNNSMVYINFNSEMSVPEPWNNTEITTPRNGNVVSNLKDSYGTPTGINLTFLDDWTGSANVGSSTGNNSGIYPDNVMKTYYWDLSGSDRHLRLSGLSRTKLYTLDLFASRDGLGNRMTIFSINGVKDSINASNNTFKSVRFMDISPDQNGQITIAINRGSGSSYSYLNALVISAKDSDQVTPPVNVKAIGTATNKIKLTWTNTSSIVSATEIWRSLSLNGEYSLVATLHEGTSYKDSGLSTNTKYFYKLKSVKYTNKSPYSTVASGTTLLYSVYVNFNEADPAALPWNSLNAVPMEGNEFPLVDPNGNNTGITLVDNGGFSGINPWGAITGNNSGIYPDNVIGSTYWVDASDSGKITLKGLNISMAYNLTFFGSRTSTEDRTTQYIANGGVVTLQTANNSSMTATIPDVVPDENGRITIAVTPGGTSTFAYIGALVIQAHSNYNNNGQVIVDGAFYQRNGLMHLNPLSNVSMSSINKDMSDFKLKLIKVYPNPFSDYVIVELNSKKDEKLSFNLYDVNGRIVDQQLMPVFNGNNRIQYEPQFRIVTGIYFLLIRSNDSETVTTVKLIKR